MGWLKADDGLPEHDKADALVERCTPPQLAAAWMVWLHMGCDCRRREVDGTFTRARALRAVRLPAPQVERALEDLVAVQLLDKTEDGWAFRNWLRYQPAAAAESERRSEVSRVRSEAGRKGNSARWGERSQTDRKPIANGSQTDRNGVATGSQTDRNGVASRSPQPSPAQPSPTQPPNPPAGGPAPAAGESFAQRIQRKAAALTVVPGGSDGG